jgi:AraC-like DNA-binding protein
MVVVYFSLIGTPDLDEKDQIASAMHFDLMKNIESYAALFSVGLYVFLSFKKLKDYREWLANVTSDSTFPDFRWLRNLLYLSAVIGVFLFINSFADIVFDLKHRTNVHWSSFSLFIAFCVYYLGVAGYQQPDYELSVEQINMVPASLEEEGIKVKSKMSSTKKEEVLQAITHALEVEKVFLNPTLSILALSRKLNIPQQEVSQVINTSLQKKFRDLINEYRVEEVKSMLMRDDVSHMSILGIALDCGFNSEATFYRIFKKNTGISPKEFRQQFK